MPIQSGSRLGPYEILSLIGVGGMGEVYRARDTRLDRIVAIKVLPAPLADEPDRREPFEREGRTIASLNHPHICTLYDIGRQDVIDFLVMEYLEGEPLAQRLMKGALPLEQVSQYAIEIAYSLDKAHRKGVTHRDLKPGGAAQSQTHRVVQGLSLSGRQLEGTTTSSAKVEFHAGELFPRVGFIVTNLEALSRAAPAKPTRGNASYSIAN